LPLNLTFDVFLVDDGSTDGTKEAVKKRFPIVNIIQGNGNLFWNQGMRIAWETASKTHDYDFYFWLNDDTNIDNNALIILLETYQEIIIKDNRAALITGACRNSDEANVYAYGGKTDAGLVFPNGQLQSCKYINGNVVLVPKDIFHVVGNLSLDYTHVLGDLDYGLRVLKEKFNCYTTKTYIATCPSNKGIPAWCDPQIPLRIRWKSLHSPKGLNIREYIIYRKKFWGWKWILYATMAYLKTLFPKTYTLLITK
jgi:GT2 family glycosyltransferase